MKRSKPGIDDSEWVRRHSESKEETAVAPRTHKIRIVKFNEAIGKRLLFLVKGTNRWLFVFENGMLCQMGVDVGWECGDEELEDEMELDTSCYVLDELQKASVIDSDWIEERNKKHSAYTAKILLIAEKQERDNYERLKLKFEPKEIQNANLISSQLPDGSTVDGPAPA